MNKQKKSNLYLENLYGLLQVAGAYFQRLGLTALKTMQYLFYTPDKKIRVPYEKENHPGADYR